MAAENALEAYRYLSQFRISCHLRAVQRLEMPENNVGISTLNATQQNMLKAVFSTLIGGRVVLPVSWVLFSLGSDCA